MDKSGFKQKTASDQGYDAISGPAVTAGGLENTNPLQVIISALGLSPEKAAIRAQNSSADVVRNNPTQAVQAGEQMMQRLKQGQMSKEEQEIIGLLAPVIMDRLNNL